MSNTYASGTITVSGSSAGTVTVNIAAGQYAWSSGDPQQTNNRGITLSASGGAVPVTSFSMTNLVMSTATAAASSDSGTTQTFTINTYIANSGSGGYVGMSLSSCPPGTTVTFAFSNQQSVTLSAAQVGVPYPT